MSVVTMTLLEHMDPTARRATSLTAEGAESFMKLLRWLICVIWIATPIKVALSQPAENEKPEEPALRLADADLDSFRGLFCVHAAMHSLGKTVDLRTLLQPKYLAESGQSSVEDLTRAVTDHGAKGLAMAGLSRANLTSAKTPLILHVNRPDEPGRYNSWIAVLSTERGLARVVEPPRQPELIPLADVLARWDGVGLFIGESIPSPTTLKLQAVCTAENLVLAIALVAAVVVLKRFSRRTTSKGEIARPVWQMAALVASFACGLAAAWHSFAQDGFVRNPVAIRTVIQQHRPSFLPKLTLAEFTAALDDPKVIVIDARFPSDYEAGHVPRAISVPIDSTPVERRALLANLPKSARVIVYCQSKHCRFDETLGAALYAEGFENVSLFPGGIEDWKEMGRPVKPSNSTGASNDDRDSQPEKP